MPNVSHRPLVWFAVCWTAGAAAASALDAPGMLLAGGALAAALLTLALAGRARPGAAAACLAAYALAAGERAWADERNTSALADLYAAAEDADRPPPQVQAAGVIASAVDLDGDRVRFTLTAHRVAVSGEPAPRALRERLLVTVRLAKQPEQAVAAGWRRGDKVRLTGELARPAPATNFGGFDYRRHLYSQRIHWLLQADGAGAVVPAGRERRSAGALLGAVDGLRSRLGAGMDRLYPQDQAGYMKGLVLGLQDDMDPGRYRQFSNLGLTHILAISGLHVAVFVFALGALLRAMRLTRERTYVLLIAAVPFYVLLAGAEPSVVRAGIMAMIALAAARLQVLKDGLHLLSAAAVLMLAWDPYMIGNVGFQLSFAVTAGLIVGVPPVRRLFPKGGKLRPLYDLGAVTLVAQAVSFPLTVYYFNQFHLLSLPANLVLVPFISFLVMPLGAASLIAAEAWLPAGSLLAAGARAANEATYAFIDGLDRADWARLILASPPGWWIAAWYGVLLAAFRLMEPRDVTPPPESADDTTQPIGETPAGMVNPYVPGGAPRRRSIGLLGPAVLAAGLLLYAYQPDRFDTAAAVEVLDVGQGDAILVRTPSGGHMLVDGGGTLRFRKEDEAWRERRDPFEVGRKVVVPLLMKRGVRVIDTLVVSHLDADHIGGLAAVLDSIPVRRVVWNGTVKPSGDAERLLRLILRKRIPVYAAGHVPPVIRLGRDAEARILWPAAQMSAGVVPVREEQNDASVVLWLKLYDARFLLTGDLSSGAEQQLLQRLNDPAGGAPGQAGAPPAADLQPIDVLKAGHHGSRTSTSEPWLSFWHPAEAAISAGRHNLYGHPSTGVLELLEARGIGVRRTDRDGGIQYRVTADGMRVRARLASGSPSHSFP